MVSEHVTHQTPILLQSVGIDLTSDKGIYFILGKLNETLSVAGDTMLVMTNLSQQPIMGGETISKSFLDSNS